MQLMVFDDSAGDDPARAIIGVAFVPLADLAKVILRVGCEVVHSGAVTSERRWRLLHHRASRWRVPSA